MNDKATLINLRWLFREACILCVSIIFSCMICAPYFTKTNQLYETVQPVKFPPYNPWHASR